MGVGHNSPATVNGRNRIIMCNLVASFMPSWKRVCRRNVLSARILPRNTSATSSPTVEVAMELAKEAYEPRLTLEHWIEEREFAPSLSVAGLKSIEDIKEKKTIQGETRDLPEMVIANGRVQMDGALLVGKKPHYSAVGMVSSEPTI